MTPYIAEFINTLTNSGYGTYRRFQRHDGIALIPCIVYLGIRGIMNSRHSGNDSVIVLCYALLIFLGVGSAAYHTNIKYETQMGEPGSCHTTTCLIACKLMTYNS
jgi:dihydroceramidase